MPKQLNLTDKLEQYIIDNSESLTEVQKEIIELCSSFPIYSS